jgi:hypothetical protein
MAPAASAPIGLVLSRLLDAVAFLEVVPRAEKLDVLGHKRRAAARVWDDVVEVEVVLASAADATPAVSSPDFELHRCRDQSLLLDAASVDDAARDSLPVGELEPELDASTSRKMPLWTQIPVRSSS